MQWNGASHLEFDGKSMETERTTWSTFPNGGKPIVEQILGSGERKKSKRAGLGESQSGIQVGKLRLLEIWAEFTRSNSSIRKG